MPTGADGAAAAAPMAPRASAPPGAGGNPFAAASGGPISSSDWAITPAQQAKYSNIFKTCNPVNGLVSGEAAKVGVRVLLMRSSTVLTFVDLNNTVRFGEITLAV